MQVIKLKSRVRADGRLRLDIPTQLSPGSVELVVILDTAERTTDEHVTYDFSDLCGKLLWKGDAVEEQRRLRDEIPFPMPS